MMLNVVRVDSNAKVVQRLAYPCGGDVMVKKTVKTVQMNTTVVCYCQIFLLLSSFTLLHCRFSFDCNPPFLHLDIDVFISIFVT